MMLTEWSKEQIISDSLDHCGGRIGDCVRFARVSYSLPPSSAVAARQAVINFGVEHYTEIKKEVGRLPASWADAGRFWRGFSIVAARYGFKPSQIFPIDLADY